MVYAVSIVTPPQFRFGRPEDWLPPEAIARTRAHLHFAHLCFPGLRPEDRLGLGVLTLACELQFHSKPKYGERAKDGLVDFLTLALGSIVHFDPDLAREAGAIPRVHVPTDVAIERVLPWFLEWWISWDAATAVLPPMIVDRLSERYQGIRIIYESIRERRMEPWSRLRVAIRYGVRQSKDRGARSTGDSRSDDVQIATGWVLAAGARDITELMMFARDGRVTVSPRAVRDALGKPRAPDGDPLSGPWVQVDREPDRTRGAEVRLREAEALAALQAVAAKRHARARKGSARQVVLEHLADLLLRELTIADLARRSGHQAKRLHQAFQEERANLRHDRDMREALGLEPEVSGD